MSGLPWARSHRCAAPAPITMAPTHVAAAFASPQEDPFLLLESTLKAVERILRHASQQPLQRCWIDHPYGEEELTRLEEEVIPAISRCLPSVLGNNWGYLLAQLDHGGTGYDPTQSTQTTVNAAISTNKIYAWLAGGPKNAAVGNVTWEGTLKFFYGGGH